MSEQLTNHPEFASLLPQLTEAELDELACQLECDGRATDPIIVWKGRGIILDGHNRYRICREKNLPYRVEEVDLPDERAAKEWIVARQLGRRNLPAGPYGNYRARLLELRTKSGVTQEEVIKAVGAATGRGRRTIFRDKRHKQNLDALAPDVRERIETGEVRAGRQTVEELAELEPIEQRRMLESASGGRLPASSVGTDCPKLLGKAIQALGVFDRTVDTLHQHFPRPQQREDIRKHIAVVNRKLDMWQQAV